MAYLFGWLWGISDGTVFDTSSTSEGADPDNGGSNGEDPDNGNAMRDFDMMDFNNMDFA